MAILILLLLIYIPLWTVPNPAIMRGELILFWLPVVYVLVRFHGRRREYGNEEAKVAP